MNESIEPNVANAEESFLEEEITEPNDSQTIETVLNKPKNSSPQKGKPVLIANGGVIDPPPTEEEICPDVIV